MNQTDLDAIRAQYVDTRPEDLIQHFPRLSADAYPELRTYSWEDIHDGALGSGALFMAADMARRLQPTPGMRVLELGAGTGAAACFLAQHYGVHVTAIDLLDPTPAWQRVQQHKVEHQVMPLQANARQLPFPNEYFDAVFCMNSYFHFGTDDLYLSYLAQFIRPGGQIIIGGPCYAAELTPESLVEFLEDSARAWHSPEWWQQHFERSGVVRVTHCAEHPRGREFWLDDTRWVLETSTSQDHIMPDALLWAMVMVMSDTERFVTHFMLHAEVTGEGGS